MTLSAVIDTNVLVSGLLWRGTPYQLLKWAEEKRLTIYTSLDILAEVYRVLHYAKFQKYIDNQHVSSDELFTQVAALCTIIQVDKTVENVCPDRDDEKFISCALSANVQVLISGDKHLLDLKQYQTVRIITAQKYFQENVDKIK